MRNDSTWTLHICRENERWLGRIEGLDLEFRGRSIEGVERRGRQGLADLLSKNPDHVSLQIIFDQPEFAKFAEAAVELRRDVELAIAQQKKREREVLAELCHHVDSNHHLSNRDIAALFGVHHRTVGQLMNLTQAQEMPQ